MDKSFHNIALVWLISIIWGCDDMVKYSPFDAEVRSSDINIKNAACISSIKEESDTLKIALISDSHAYYDELIDAIKSINQ